MEQRKLIRHGLSSLTVALPIKWTKNYGLKKGDSVFVKQEASQLVISTERSVEINDITVDVSDLDRTSLLLYVQSLYRFGYDTIEIRFNKPTTTHHRKGKGVTVSSTINHITNRLIGAEIIEQKENKIIIKYITKEAEEDFKIILRRIFLLLKDTSANLVEGIRKNDQSLLESIEESHDNINKFVNYALRLLNKYGYPDVKKSYYYFHIIAQIDKIVDVPKYTARDIMRSGKQFSKESIKIFEQIHKSISLYCELFYKFDLKTVNELSRNRDDVKISIQEKIKALPQEELLQLINMKQVLELILDLTDFRLGLEY